MAQSKRTPALPTAVNPGFSEIDVRLSAGHGGMDVLPPAVGVVELAKAPRHFPTCRAGALSARRREAKNSPMSGKMPDGAEPRPFRGGERSAGKNAELLLAITHHMANGPS